MVTPPSPDPKGVTGSRLPVPTQRGHGVMGSRFPVPTQRGHGVTPPDSEKKGHRVTPRCPEHCFTQLAHARSDSEHPPSGSKITPLHASPQAKLGFRAAGEVQGRVSTLPRYGVAGRVGRHSTPDSYTCTQTSLPGNPPPAKPQNPEASVVAASDRRLQSKKKNLGRRFWGGLAYPTPTRRRKQSCALTDSSPCSFREPQPA